MAPDAQWHWEQGNKYALEGMKVLLALNGGAAIALLTFAGHAGSPLAISRVGYALLLFGVGALFAALVFLTAYLTQLCYGNNNWPRAHRLHNVSYTVVTLSIMSFLFGLYFAYSSLPSDLAKGHLTSQVTPSAVQRLPCGWSHSLCAASRRRSM